jgi:hypothetical protein
MIAGAHDERVQKLVKADMEAKGLTEEAANEFHIVELVLD